MVEISTIAATLAAAISALKEIGRVAEKTKDRDLNQRVLELQQALMTANTQLLELATENQSFRQQASELRHAADTEKQLLSDGGVYWWMRDSKRDGPYCKTCWHKDKSLAQLTWSLHGYLCARCKGSYAPSQGGA
jgi:hypothetical protein